jgi:hypothetical protein
MVQTVSRVLVFQSDALTLNGILDAFESFTWDRSLWDEGTFHLRISVPQFINDPQGIAKGGWLGPVISDEELEAAAPDHLYRIESIEFETLVNGGQIIVIEGRDVGGYLKERTVNPATGQDYDAVASAPAETAIKGYVARHMGALAAVVRRLPNFVVATDLGRGVQVSEQARYQYVSEIVNALGQRSDMGWEVTFDPNTGQHIFDVVPGVDRSETVFLDASFDTARKLRWFSTDVGKKTFGLIAGQGELGARTIVAVFDGDTQPSGFDRREVFLDGRDTNDATILEERGMAALQDTVKTDNLSCEIHPYGSFRYRRDFDLGDIVTIRSKDWNLSRIVRVVKVSGQIAQGTGTIPEITIELDSAFPSLDGVIEELQQSSASVGANEITAPAIGAVRKAGDTMQGNLLFANPVAASGMPADEGLVPGLNNVIELFGRGNTVVTGIGDTYLVTNAHYDGNNWYRINDALGAARMGITKTGVISVHTAAAGSGAISWTLARTI